MSLFSRLDRVRNGREAKDRDEGGLFGVPDLGTPSTQAPANPASTSPTPNESPEESQSAAPSPFAAVPQNLAPAETQPEIEAELPEVSNQEAETESVFQSASPFSTLIQSARPEPEPEFEQPEVELPHAEFSQAELPPQSLVAEALSYEPASEQIYENPVQYPEPAQQEDGQDLARLALGETAETEPEKESPFMSVIAPPVHTSAAERLPTPKGPFRRPAMFKGDNKEEGAATPAETAKAEEKDFVSDDTNLDIPAAEVESPAVAAPTSEFDDLPGMAAEPLPSIPAASSLPSASPNISEPEPIPAKPEATPAPTTPAVKSPFDRLMAERVSAAPSTPPAQPVSEAKPRPSLLDRLNARAATVEEVPAPPAKVIPVRAQRPVAPPVPEPVVADQPLDRDSEIPAQYMPQSAPEPETVALSVATPAASAPVVTPLSVPPVEIPAAAVPTTPVIEEPVAASPVVSAPPVAQTPIASPTVTPLNPNSGATLPPREPFVAPTPVAPVSTTPLTSAISPRPTTPLINTPPESMAIEKTAEPRGLSSLRTENRGFADRLAARQSLDRDLSVPVPEATSRPTGAELVRIDEEANLSEKEMKVRILYRQKHLIFDSVLGSLDPRLMQNPTRETLRPPIERAVDGALREFNLGLDPSERLWMIDEFIRETTDVGPLVPLLDDPGISKIIVTGANDVSVEKLGRIERVGISFRDDDHLLGLVRRIAEMTGGRIDAKVPLLDRPLPDGSRIRAKVPPIAPQPSLTIEKSTGNPFIALKRSMSERTRGEALPYNQLRERIQLRLLREFEGNTAATANQEKLRVQVEEMIGHVIIEEKVAVTRAEKAALVMDLLNEIVGLGPLEPLLNDPDVDEVMVNGPYQIYVERKGKLELSNQRFRDNAHAMQVIERIIAPLGRRVDEKSPMVDGRLRDGSRFNAIIPPLALGGPTMTIRKFARDPFTMTDLINFGSLTREAAQFLHAAVEGRLNIIVSGGTGSGKTTTLNVLSSFIPTSDRIVTIEDAAELQLRQEHTIRLETRPANIEGVGEVTIRDLVRNALRMRPDRIVVGECRGGEALDMLQAMNTGHDGSLTTAHSNGPRDTLKRLETMVMMAGFDLPVKAIREQVAMAVQLIVHQERMRDGKRRITAVTEIVGMEGDVITLQDLFRFEQERIDDEGRIHGMLAPTGLRPKNWDTIIDNGAELSMDMFQRVEQGGGVRSRLNDHRTGPR